LVEWYIFTKQRSKWTMGSTFLSPVPLRFYEISLMLFCVDVLFSVQPSLSHCF
jgi:hypothetical protein